jgi:hypothetical protein
VYANSVRGYQIVSILDTFNNINFDDHLNITHSGLFYHEVSNTHYLRQFRPNLWFDDNSTIDDNTISTFINTSSNLPSIENLYNVIRIFLSYRLYRNNSNNNIAYEQHYPMLPTNQPDYNNPLYPIAPPMPWIYTTSIDYDSHLLSAFMYKNYDNENIYTAVWFVHPSVTQLYYVEYVKNSSTRSVLLFSDLMTSSLVSKLNAGDGFSILFYKRESASNYKITEYSNTNFYEDKILDDTEIPFVSHGYAGGFFETKEIGLLSLLPIQETHNTFWTY